MDNRDPMLDFVAGIYANPDDDTGRLALADALDELDRPTEFQQLRAQWLRAALGPNREDYKRGRIGAKESKWLAEHGPKMMWDVFRPAAVPSKAFPDPITYRRSGRCVSMRVRVPNQRRVAGTVWSTIHLGVRRGLVVWVNLDWDGFHHLSATVARAFPEAVISPMMHVAHPIFSHSTRHDPYLSWRWGVYESVCPSSMFWRECRDYMTKKGWLRSESYDDGRVLVATVETAATIDTLYASNYGKAQSAAIFTVGHATNYCARYAAGTLDAFKWFDFATHWNRLRLLSQREQYTDESGKLVTSW